MKFVKSNFAKKLIIILVILMIFNIAIPKKVHASWNFSGILMKPFTYMALSFLVSVDVGIGILMSTTDIALNGVGTIVEEITEKDKESDNWKTIVINGTERTLSKLFIGPDTIFTGQVSILDANIFEADTTLEDAIREDDVDVNIGDGKVADTVEGVVEGAVDDAAESVENIATTIAKRSEIYQV